MIEENFHRGRVKSVSRAQRRGEILVERINRRAVFEWEDFWPRREPRRNEPVQFFLERNPMGQLLAFGVRAIEDRQQPRGPGRFRPLQLLALPVALLFWLLLYGAVKKHYMPALFYNLYLALGLLSAALYGWDKCQAQRGGWRLSETTLHCWDLLGGWFGGTVAQLAFHHKIRKRRYQLTHWLLLPINVGVMYWLLYVPSGNRLLATVYYFFKNMGA